MLSIELILSYGGEIKSFEKNEYIFKEGQQARYFYQVITGEVKMNNFLENGKEFIQSIFSASRSFGEPPLFADIPYPANALALVSSKIIQLKKEKFFNLLTANPEVHLSITKTLATRLQYKAIMAAELSSQEPEHRILRILDYLKNDVYKLNTPFSFKVNLTRQQLADLTGLRVETVIRATKNLEHKNELKIRNRKLYR